MIKLLKAEFKKIFLKPGIFIMTGILALVLAFSYFFFVPQARVNTSISIRGDNLYEIYNNYTNSSYEYSKSSADALIERANQLITEYKSENESISKILNEKLDIINIDTFTFIDRVGRSAGATNPGEGLEMAEVLRKNILSELEDFSTSYISYSNETYPKILINSSDHDLIIRNCNSIIATLKAVGSKQLESYVTMREYLENMNISNSKYEFKFSFTKYVNNIKDIEVGDEFLSNLYDNYYLVAEERILNIKNSLDQYYLEHNTDEFLNSMEKKEKLNEYVSLYYNTSKQALEIIENKINLQIANTYEDSEFVKFYRYSSFNRYQSEQLATRQEYLFQNNKMDYEFANAFGFLTTSNFEANAFDFAYFVLELFSFIIIIYCVVLGSGMIAGEQANGTLKLLAIRPYKRSKLLTSKILATLFFIIIFVLFSSVIAFIAGGTLYGFNSLPVLAIFDSNTAFVISPIILYFIYILTLIAKIFVYISLAFFISTLFKSYVGAVTVSILCFFATSILNVYLSASKIFKFFPLSNLDLFKYFGGGYFASGNSASIINMFTSPILLDTNFMFSLINVIITTILILGVTFVVFRKRDIA